MTTSRRRPLIWLLPLAFAYLLVAQMNDTEPEIPVEPEIPDMPEDPSDPESIRRWLELRAAAAASEVVTKDRPPEIPPPVLDDDEKAMHEWVTSRRMIGHRYDGDSRDPNNLVLLRIEDPVLEDTRELGKFAKLAHLDLLFPRFDHRGWRAIAEDTKLQRLLVYKNRVAPPAEALQRLEVETILIFRNAKFETDLVLDPFKMGSLKWLEVSNTALTTDQVRVIADLTSLEILDLHKTQVDDGVFDLIKGLDKLRILRLNDCPVSTDKLDAWAADHPDVVVNGPRPERLDGRTR